MNQPVSDRVARLRLGPFAIEELRGLRQLRDLPTPTRLPFFGNALSVDPNRAVEIFERWAKQLGALCAAHFPAGILVLVTDPELNEPMLRARPDALRRWSGIEPVFEEVGARGVFSAEGDAWKAQRALVVEALSQKHQRAFFPTLRQVTERLFSLWRRAAGDNLVIDPTTDLMRFTTDVTVSLAFGTDMNSLEGGGALLQEHLSQVFPMIGRRLNAVFPYWRYFRLPADRKLDRSLKHIRKVQEGLLADARTRLTLRAEASPSLAPRDMLEAMLLARDESGEAFSDEAIYGNMLTLLLAGEDTTAYAISWAIHYLADHPEVVAQMREEVDERNPLGGVLADLAMAAPLPWIDAVGQEALRLRSPAPAAPLESLVDMILDDVFVPRGTAIQLMTRLPGLEENRFENPERFLPQRWLKDSAYEGPHDARSHIPFGSGPRICPGRSLALLELRLVLAMLVQNFDLERVGRAEDVKERTTFVLAPVGVRVRLQRRVDHLVTTEAKNLG